MKLDLELQDQDLQLPDDDLVHKAQDALRKALDEIQPGLGQKLHAHEGEYLGRGGEVRAVGDLTDLVEQTYAQRCDRMLNDLAELLIKHPRT